jgi:hypothetical protein
MGGGHSVEGEINSGGGIEQIRIDIGGLREFAAAVRSHVDESLRGQVRQTYTVYEQGVGFGSALAHSGDIQAARVRYHDCLTAMSAALADQLSEAEAMVMAAEEVAHRYATADAMASASSADIDTAWSGAYAAAQQQVAREQLAYEQRERRVR